MKLDVSMCMMKLDVSMFRKAQVFGWALEAPRVSWAPFWYLLTDCFYVCITKVEGLLLRGCKHVYDEVGCKHV